jgi:hypothetical protein
MKRSSQVALLLMGTVAVGGGAYAMMPSENCQPNQPGVQQNQNCNRSWRGASSGGGYGSSSSSSTSSRQGFTGDGSTSSGSSPVHGGSGSIARGGFGSFASHFSGGG